MGHRSYSRVVNDFRCMLIRWAEHLENDVKLTQAMSPRTCNLTHLSHFQLLGTYTVFSVTRLGEFR